MLEYSLLPSFNVLQETVPPSSSSFRCYNIYTADRNIGDCRRDKRLAAYSVRTYGADQPLALYPIIVLNVPLHLPPLRLMTLHAHAHSEQKVPETRKYVCLTSVTHLESTQNFPLPNGAYLPNLRTPAPGTMWRPVRRQPPYISCFLSCDILNSVPPPFISCQQQIAQRKHHHRKPTKRTTVMWQSCQ